MTTRSVDDVLKGIEAWRAGKLWGAKAIANEAGVSTRTVARWEQLPDCPITIVAGRYFVVRVDLILWMTSKSSRQAMELSEAV